MRTAIVTGANGFIGARVAANLLAGGWKVYAVGRGKPGRGWAARVRDALDAIGDKAFDAAALARLESRELDLLAPRLGLDSPQSAFPEQDITLFHVAGDTRFTPSDPEAQRRINVEGTLNVLRGLAPVITRAVHVSTAFVAGAREGALLESEFAAGQQFRNNYEKTKLEAELAARGLCAQINIPLVIARPAIVINDTRTGRSSTFTHLNALIEVINRIQEHFGLTDGQVISKRIRLAVDPDGRSNLIPIDPMIDALIRIALDPRAPGRAYHLCHPAPQSNREIVNLIAEQIGVRGKVGLDFVSSLGGSASHTEKMIARSLKVYVPYMNDRSRFDLAHTREIIPEYDNLFPQLDTPYIQKVIRFQRETRSLSSPVECGGLPPLSPHDG